MSRWFYIAITLLAVAAWAVLSGGDQVKANGIVVVTLSPQNLTMGVGQFAVVSVEAGPGAINLYGAQIQLSYDSNIIEVVDIVQGALLSGNGTQDNAGGFFQEVNIDNNQGTARSTSTLLDPASATNASGELAQYLVRCLATGVSNLQFSELILADETSAVIPSQGQNGTVTCGEIDLVTVRPVPPTQVLAGAEFEVLIQADDVTNLTGAEVTLNFDPNLLLFVSAQASSNFDGCFADSNMDPPGVLSTVIACSTGRSGAPLDLWIVKFIAASVQENTDTVLTTTDVLLGDSTPANIPAQGASATLTIFVGVCGDQNDDGLVNVFDAIIDLQIIVGKIDATPLQMILSDVVPDGEINVFDVILTLQHIVGSNLITTCGIGGPNEL